jgi:hypothetical protein
MTTQNPLELESMAPDQNADGAAASEDIVDSGHPLVQAAPDTTQAYSTSGSAWVVGYGTALKWGAALAAFAYLFLYLYIALSRISYPFAIEWLEDGMAQGVQRILEGKGIYVAPTVEYIPFIYTPLFYYLGAAAAYFLEMSFFPLRLVSFVASLGCFLVIFLHVLRETRSAWAGWIAVGLYAATFQVGGAWFDLARVDSTFLFFILLAVFMVRFARSQWIILLASVVLCLAFLTKHSAVGVIAALVVGTVFLNWRHALVLLVSTGVLCAVSCWVLDIMSEGWFTYYIFDAVTGHGWEEHRWIQFWTVDLAQKTAILCAVAIVGLFLQLGGSTPRPFFYYGCVTGGIVIMSWLSRVHVGGYINVLMPTFAWAAILFGFAIGGVARHWINPLPHQRAALYAAMSALCVIQFALLIYDPREQIPTKAHYAMGEYLLDMMADKEDILIPRHSYLPALAGKKVYTNKAAYSSLLADYESPHRQQVTADLTAKLRDGHFDLIILNEREYLAGLVNRYYKPISAQFPNVGRSWPLTGYRTRPVQILVPR